MKNNRSILWLALFILGFVFSSFCISYISNLSNVYQTSQGLHRPTMTNTPIPIGLIVLGAIILLILILIIKSIIEQRKVVIDEVSKLSTIKGDSKVDSTSPFFKGLTYSFVTMLLFFGFAGMGGWLVAVFYGFFNDFIHTYSIGISEIIKGPQEEGVFRFVITLIIFTLFIFSALILIFDKIKEGRNNKS